MVGMHGIYYLLIYRCEGVGDCEGKRYIASATASTTI